jgi:DNA-binding LytR/AlgR family response regulator
MDQADKKRAGAMAPTALIADDEAELRRYLKTRLAEVWPELEICAEAANGIEALAAIGRLSPQIAFLDIRMPGLTGLEVAAKLEPASACHLVFVTAYDEYAVTAFEKQAVDYLLKPVTSERLSQTVFRLKRKLEQTTAPPAWMAALAQELLENIPAGSKGPDYLKWLRVQRGEGVELVSVSEVVYFQTQDKYTAAVTQNRTHLLRTSIRDLTTQLDPDAFWQIHRSTIVNVSQIAKVGRGLTGRGLIRLKDRTETLTVSRPYLKLFRQM